MLRMLCLQETWELWDDISHFIAHNCCKQLRATSAEPLVARANVLTALTLLGNIREEQADMAQHMVRILCGTRGLDLTSCDT